MKKAKRSTSKDVVKLTGRVKGMDAVKEKEDVPGSIALKSAPAEKKEENAPPAVATPSPAPPVTTFNLSLPSDEKNTLGDIPPSPQVSVPQAPVKNLGIAMKQELMNASPSSCKTRHPAIASAPSSDDEDEFDLTPSVGNIISNSSSSRIGSCNEIYGYQYACPYIVTAHMGKNGPHSDEKIYDKEFLTHLFVSIQQRDALGAQGFLDQSLLCNQLKIHSVKIMREQRENRGKQFRYSNGGVGFFHVFVRVFSKKQVRKGLNNEEEVLKWLEDIRVAFCNTKAQYPFRLAMGGLLGKHRAHVRALDTNLLDADVAEYARMIYAKKIANGSMMKEIKRVNQFFSPWNEEAARDLLS